MNKEVKKKRYVVCQSKKKNLKKKIMQNLPSMIHLMKSPRLNYFFIQSLKKYQQQLIQENPIYKEILEKEPEKFDRLSLIQYRDIEKNVVWSTILICSVWTGFPFVFNLLEAVIQHSNYDFSSILTKTYEDGKNIHGVFVPEQFLHATVVYSGLIGWRAFRASRLLSKNP